MNLFRQGFVLRRHTAHGIRDTAARQLQPIVRTFFVFPFGEAEFQQRRIKQVAGIIARKRAACEIRPPQAGCEANDEKFRIHGPE